MFPHAGSCVMPANVGNNFGHASRNAKFLLHHRNATPLTRSSLPQPLCSCTCDSFTPLATRVHVCFSGSTVTGEASAVAQMREHQTEDQVVSVGPFTL